MQQLKQAIIKRLKKLLGTAEIFFMFFISNILGVNNKKVVFNSFGGKSYSDNPKAISEKLHEMFPDYKIIWLFNNLEEKREIVPSYIKCVKKKSFTAIFELATAKFWVDNFGKPVTTYKSKKQVYIQTWHGDRGFKKILYDVPSDDKDRKFIESEICDLFISGSDYADRKISSAFKYSGQILKTGCPRNDLLIENDSKKKLIIKERLKIDENTGVLLFAPTLRQEAAIGQKMQFSREIDLPEVIKTLEEKTNNKWICLVRAHSSVKGLAGIPSGESRILDVTEYEDMSDLLLISDFLITDYSSSAGDFILLNRPLVLFQPDREEYERNDRTFYFDLDKSPYMIAFNQEHLIDIIKKIDIKMIPQYCQDIRDFYGTIETGKASKNVVEYMQNKK